VNPLLPLRSIITHPLSSSVSEVININTKLLKPIAAKFNLSLNSFGEVITDPSVPYYGSIVVSNPWSDALEPAPVSPYKGSVAFDVLSGTIKSVYNAHRGLKGDNNIKVYPTYVSGNTGELIIFPAISGLMYLNRYHKLLGVIGEHLSIQPRKRVGA
jgi:hypothetical protein